MTVCHEAHMQTVLYHWALALPVSAPVKIIRKCSKVYVVAGAAPLANSYNPTLLHTRGEAWGLTQACS